MKRVHTGDAADDPGRGVERHDVGTALGTEGVAVVRYRVPPGEGLPAGLHAHRDQEEVFVVLSGEAAFEVLLPGDPSGEGDRVAREVSLSAGEAVRFAPGEFQSGRNAGAEPLELLALGAPRESEDVRIPVDCPACGPPEVELVTGGDSVAFACPDCGESSTPAPCPTCGGEDLRVTLARGGESGDTAVECADCGARYDSPPFG